MGEKRGGWEYLKLALCVAGGLVIAQVTQGKIGSILLPLVAAYVGARLARPSAEFLSRACHVSVKVGGAVYAILICGGAIYLITTLSGRLVDQLGSILEHLPEYAKGITETVESFFERVPFLAKLGGQSEMGEIFRGAVDKTVEYVGEKLAGFLGDTVQAFPGGVMSAFVAAVGFIYLTADMDGAGRSVSFLLPERYAARIKSAFGDVSGALFSYLKAYATLMAVTFLILSVGLSVIGARGPLAVALIIAFVDALPVFGCGSVMIPWAVWSFLSGEIGRGAGLLILLGVVYIVRQFLEPRVIGRMTGVHPFVALACVFVGLKLGGIGGMIVAPIALSCAVQIKKDKR